MQRRLRSWRALQRKRQEQRAGNNQITVGAAYHVIVLSELNGVTGAEVGTVAAEGAGTKVEAECDLFALIIGKLLDGTGDCAAGADTLTHAAGDAAVGMIDDAAAVLGCCLNRDERIHVAAGFGEQLLYGFFNKRKIHYIFSLFSLSIWVARARPSMTASGLGAQPATATSTCTYFDRGPAME